MSQNQTVVGFVRFCLWTAGALGFGLFGVWVVRNYSQWILHSQSFSVKRIEITGNDLVAEKEILNLGTVPVHRNIWKMDLRECERKIETHPFIQNAVVSRRFPNVLVVCVEEKNPIALLNTGGILYSIDSKGILLPSRTGRLYDLPVVSSVISGPVRTGRPVQEESALKCVEFIRLILEKRSELYSEISEMVYAKPEGLIVYTRKRGVPVRLGLEGYERKIRYLEALLSEWKQGPEPSDIDYVDLRFEGQVVLGMGA